MSQDPLKNLQRLAQRPRGAFPDALYDEQVLKPAAGRVTDALRSAALDVYLAHAVMLVEQRIVDGEQARDLLAALAPAASAVNDDVARGHPLEPVARQVASAAHGAGFLAGAREEVTNTAMRMVLRERLLDLTLAVLEARQALAAVAAANLTTIVLATSNGQSVQPTTLGHYLAGQLGPLARGCARVHEAFTRLNQAPLGAVAGMSTAMPIRRERTAELLGFAGSIDSTFDALAGGDALAEPLAIITLLASESARLVTDLAYWARDDVGVLAPGDEFVHSDTGQPQRRDPLVFDHLRLRLAGHGQAFGALAQVLAGRAMLGAEAAQFDAFIRVETELREAASTYQLLARVVSSLEVNRAISAARANRGFATSSELADLLAIDCKLPPAQARELAERVVVEALQGGLDALTLTAKFVDQVALRAIGQEVGIEPETLSRCLAPKRFLERRTVLGGPAPAAVTATLERESFAARQDAGWVRDRRAQFGAARQRLWERRDALLSGMAERPAQVE